MDYGKELREISKEERKSVWDKYFKYLCLRCGHEWNGRNAGYPTVCPQCKSPYWDKERK